MNTPVPEIPHMTPGQFRALGHRMVDWIAEYWERVEQFPVLSRARPGDVLSKLPEHPPRTGLDMNENSDGGVDGSWEAVFRDLESIILPGITHWQSPNFYAFFPANGSAPGVLGEILSAGLGINGMLWATSPACTELEMRVLDWMGEMLGLPAAFRTDSESGGAVIQGTASESTLVAMLAARQRMAASGERAAGGELVVYASTQAHSSVIKAAMIAGLAKGPEDREQVRLIETDDSDAMKPDALEAAMREDLSRGRVPFYVCATVGTTSSTAIDPVDRIADVIERVVGVGENAKPRPWLHVDAAHAGSACICPEFRWILKGIDRADSFCFNPHKWLLTNFDCDCLYTSDRASLVGALAITPEYLRNVASASGQVIDYRDWHAPLGRRFRALKLWFVIRHYGVEGLRAHIREHVRIAAALEEWIRADDRFEIVAPRVLNLVCFRLRGGDDRNRALLEKINASGRAYLTHTMLPRGGENVYVLRLCVGATATREGHVRATWGMIREMV